MRKFDPPTPLSPLTIMNDDKQTADEIPPKNSRDVPCAKKLRRLRLFGAVLKLWGDAITVWLKIIAALLAGFAAILKAGMPFNW
ncbi:hypothetical protein [Haladaptatus salinisoli]|uniref:hypothetical protein n=1 Tax=Haladaptatus salinisoli TaxID=2884876 RepID=UPI001D0A605E|nr:hypothetical protein [Haladaptatus salinisoli]